LTLSTKEGSTIVKKPLLHQSARYLVASVAALGVDFSTYWALVRLFHITIPVAAGVGYSTGLVISYFFLVGYVFNNRWLEEKKGVEVILFVLSGGLGVVITYQSAFLYVKIADGGNLYVAKLLTVCASFVSVFLFRKFIVFRSKEPDR